jgi:predicted NBD/HSP70 family sugar kinase
MERVEPFTRAELTEATALSAPTVGTLTVHLIRNGLIRHLGTGPSRGGRRPSFMEFNARYGFVGGVAIDPGKTRVALADLRGERLAVKSWPTPVGLPPAPLIAKIASWVKQLLSEAGIGADKLLSVAAAAPGVVDHVRGRVLALAPNLKGWDQVPIAEMLTEALGGVPVTVENDVNLAILGERWRGAAIGHDTGAFIYVGTGIGAGVVINGNLHRGHHFLAGEIGLMLMGPQYLEQDFGSTGCLESLAGLKALTARMGAAAGKDREKDKRSRKVVEEAAQLVGIATTNLALTIDPSLVILAGPVVELEGFMDEVKKIVRRIIPTPPDIVSAKLGEEAPLWGSLLQATTAARVYLRQRLRN